MKASSDDPEAARDCGLPRRPEGLRAESLGEKLEIMTASLPEGGVTLAELRDLVGRDGLLLLTIFLSLVFMVPISIPGLSTVFGGGILLIGVSRALGRSLWLPRRLATRVFAAGQVREALRKGDAWLRRLERVSRPHRLDWLATGRAMEGLADCALIVGALLLMAPFGLVPFSNTLPALALLFLSIGLLQRDGLFILLGHLANLATVVYFSVLVVGGGVAVFEVFRRFAGNGS